MANLAKSSRISDYKEYNWAVSDKDVIRYPDIINFERAGSKGDHHCVMCGTTKGPNCVIPNQNKDVCKTCDSSFWLLHHLNVLVKFCKGCKKFSALQDFDEKPEASKCAKCRKRGRQNYYSRKQDDDDTALLGAQNQAAAHEANRLKAEAKVKDRKPPSNKAKSKEKTQLDKVASNRNRNGMVLNKKSLNQLHSHKNAMDDSGETDKSSSSLNVTSSTSSESCPSPNSYLTSNNNKQPHMNTYHLTNHSFSSPSFNDTSELDILGFPTVDTDNITCDSKSKGIKVPCPFRPESSRHKNDGQFKVNTPSNGAFGVTDTCPDTNASVVSCSSQISDSGGAYFSNSYLWPDSLKEIERNSLSNGTNHNQGRAGGADALGSNEGSNNLTNNPMSCFQLPTGFPSAVKKVSNLKSRGYPPDSRTSSRGSSSGVAMDRRDSRESGKSSNASSKNSSLSSIGSAGGLPMTHFGDLGGIGVANQGNTPGLLLSITPQSFTPHGSGGGFDIITPFTGTPMFSHSPFDSINTPDSNWKWDPSANALMNLASISAEVLTNTPPAEDKPDEEKTISVNENSTVATGTTMPPARKCSSDPGKSNSSQVHDNISTENNGVPPTGLPVTMVSMKGVPSNDESDLRTSEVSDGQRNDKSGKQSPEHMSSPFPHIEDDNIYQIALDSSQSLELSPPIPEGKKRSIVNGVSNAQEESATSSKASQPPAKKLRL